MINFTEFKEIISIVAATVVIALIAFIGVAIITVAFLWTFKVCLQIVGLQ
jgi:hypothetical protein